MSLLRGTFAWTLVVSFEGVTAWELDNTLDPLRSADLAVTLYPLTRFTPVAARSTQLQLTVHGADHPGIVSAITRVIADFGGNITDLSTRLANELYVVVAEFELPVDIELERFSTALRQTADSVGVRAHLAPADSDLL